MKRVLSAITGLLICAATLSAQSKTHSLTVMVNPGARSDVRACVTLIPKSGDLIFDQTNRSGRVKFKNVPMGDYRIVVKLSACGLQKKEITVGPDTDTVTFHFICLDGTESSVPSGQR